MDFRLDIVIFAALDFNYSEKIYEAQRLIEDHREAFSETTTDILETIIAVLEFYGPAREHIYTLSFQ